MQEATYLEHPAINDLYIVNFTKIFPDVDSEYKYGLIRIMQLSSGQVEFQVSRTVFWST